MSWERWMVTLFEDLEQQAEGLALAERDAEIADLTQAEYLRVSLAARLHASVGTAVRVRLLGGLSLGGRISRLGEDWFLLVDGAAEWIVRSEAVVSAAGLSPRALAEESWSVVDRLSLRAILRRFAADATVCTVHFLDQQTTEGRVARVGQDFAELLVGEGAERTVHLLPLASIAALQERP